MTIEGEIAAFGEMAHGAVHRGGRSGRVARLFIVAAILAFAAGVIAQLVSLFR